MPRVHGPKKYYAVRIGREGSRIYDSHAEFKDATCQFSGGSAKGFNSLNEAQDWLHEAPRLTLAGDFHPSWLLRERTNPDPSSSSDVVRTESRRRPPGGLRRRHTGEGSSSADVVTPAAPEVARPLVMNPITQPMDIDSKKPITKVTPEVPAIELSPQQQLVLDMVRSGRNIFFTGPAGTGKSVLLKEIINLFRDKPDAVAVTASTGIAGLNIGGSTIHSFAGIGLGKESVEKLIQYLRNAAKARWRATSALIIDEISMIDARLFDKLEEVARKVRGIQKPFGGIQLIISGDFFQLPPVPERDSRTSLPSTFAFDAESWPQCIQQTILLTQVFRQKNQKFISMLSAARNASLLPWHIEEFKKLERPLVRSDGVMPTQLFPSKAEVEQCNARHLSQLSGPFHTFSAMDSRGYNAYGEELSEKAAKALLDSGVVPQELAVKVGAQVMLLRNINQTLVNGSVGTVIEFVTAHEARKRMIGVAEPKGETENDHRRPLRKLNNEYFSTKALYPLVRFGRDTLLCAPVDFDVQGIPGNIEARRMQVPLILAWAMTVHKSQGQTLHHVKVDLTRTFEKGQAYVALSRATSMEGLEIVGFDPVGVQAHPRVVAWHAAIVKQEQERLKQVQEEEMDMDEAIDRYHAVMELEESMSVDPAVDTNICTLLMQT